MPVQRGLLFPFFMDAKTGECKGKGIGKGVTKRIQKILDGVGREISAHIAALQQIGS